MPFSVTRGRCSEGFAVNDTRAAVMPILRLACTRAAAPRGCSIPTDAPDPACTEWPDTFLPDGGDVQQHIGFPVALLRLVRFETVNREQRQFSRRAIAFCSGDNPCFLGQMGGQRMIVVIGSCRSASGQSGAGYGDTHPPDEIASLYRRAADNRRYQRIRRWRPDRGGGLRLFATHLLHRLLGHVAFTPQFGGLAALAKG